MLFEMFPTIVYKTSGPNMTDLPVEMSANILRYLDAQSLSCAATTNKKWMNVCRGDPILRERLKAEAQEKKKRNLQFLYSVNVIKNVIKRKVISDPERECVPLKRARIFKYVMEENKKKSIKKSSA